MKFKRTKETEIEKFNKKFPKDKRKGKFLIATNGVGEITDLETGNQDMIKWAKKNLPDLELIIQKKGVKKK